MGWRGPGVALLLLAAMLLPVWPGAAVELDARYAQYACAPCGLAKAFVVDKVYGPAGRQLLHQDVVLYYHGDYLAEANDFQGRAYVGGCFHAIHLTGRTRRRSLLSWLLGSIARADVLSWRVRP